MFAGETAVAQRGADLGERMLNALTLLREELGEAGIIIGSDCLDLDTSLLHAAARALDDSELVLAPAVDGGYVLIGCRRADHGLFAGVDWGGPRVLRQTLANARELGVDVHQLATLRDIDRLADLDPYPELLALISR